MASGKAGVAGLAGRYATALFDLADEQSALEQVESDIKALGSMLDASPDLRHFISSPILKREERSRGIAALAAAAGVCDLSARFLGALAHNRRLFVLPGVIESFLAKLSERRGESVAEIVAARPLSPAQATAVASALAASVGGNIKVDVKVDPSLIGGLVVRVGSRMVDSSIRAKLQRLQLSMKGVG